MDETDFQLVFRRAPVGMVYARRRVIYECNERMGEIFAYSRELLIRQSFARLYPSQEEFERQGQRMYFALHEQGVWSDQRIMRRATGEHFWCRVTGSALDPADPYAQGVWVFEDLSLQRPLKGALTSREREVASWIIEGLTSKEIGRMLGISHRTVDVHRASLMRKFGASRAAELVRKLIQSLADQ